MSKITAAQTAAATQLLDPEVLYKGNTFISFVTTWIVRYVDPKRTHPKPMVEYVYLLLRSQSLQNIEQIWCCRLPLPTEVPIDFKVLPEYVVEDATNYLAFVVRSVSLHLSTL